MLNTNQLHLYSRRQIKNEQMKKWKTQAKEIRSIFKMWKSVEKKLKSAVENWLCEIKNEILLTKSLSVIY